METIEVMAQVQPEDLIKFGFIPEFIGRLPILATLNDLSVESLVKILVEPKNALIKQYRKLLALEGVELKFTEAALGAFAQEAFERKSGARGLRAIMERVMLDIMYDLPSLQKVRECVIGEECVRYGQAPMLLYEREEECA